MIYETVFIINPVLSEAQSKEAVNNYVDLLKSKKAKIISEESWGLKKLAYHIQNKKTGFYFLVEFESDDSQLIADLELAFKRDEKIMRWLVVKMDKNAQKYAERRKKKLKK
jgi:small subunit ribosomal protein S6